MTSPFALIPFIYYINSAMLSIYYRNKSNTSLTTRKKFTKGCWINVESPDANELNVLVQDFGLDMGHLSDALDPHEVPRYEREDSVYYFFLRFAQKSKNNKVETIPLLIAVGPDILVTVCSTKIPQLENLLKNKNLYTTKKTKMLILLLLHINNIYKSFVNTISKEVKNLSTGIEQIDNKDIIKFVEFERTLEDFMSSLVPSNMILENILYGKVLRLYDEDAELLEDVSLSNTQLIEICKANIKNIVNTREAYSTIMSNNLNKTMKLLTSITIILTIPTMISSFYGMNVNLPLQAHPLAYAWILFVTLVFSIF